jgi:hypothetical protein
MQNLFFYGYNANVVHQRIRAHIGPIRTTQQTIGACAVPIKTSRSHHEFDIAACLNSQSVSDLMEYVKDVVCLKRIDAKPHSVVIQNIHLLKPSFLQALKSLVCMYSDRTVFILSSKSLTRIPRGIIYNAVMIRCPAPPQHDIDYGVFGAALDELSTAGPMNMERVRHFAYTCIGFNISYSFFATALISKLADTEHIRDIVAICAENESASLIIKKDVMAWERTFVQVHEHLVRLRT